MNGVLCLLLTFFSFKAFTIDLSITQRQPRWTNSYVSAELLSQPIEGYFLGLQAGLGNDRSSRRSAYRLSNTLSLTEAIGLDLIYLHQDWFFISTGRDTFAFRFDFFHPRKNEAGIFGSTGIYARWQKQRWNSSPHTPLMFNTDDKENFLVLLIGWNFPLDQQRYWRIQVKNFAAFNFLGPDHWNFELHYTLMANAEMQVELQVGGLVSGFSGVTGYFNELHSSLRLSYF